MEHFQPDPKKIEDRKQWEKDVFARQNALSNRARFVQGSQKQRKQQAQ